LDSGGGRDFINIYDVTAGAQIAQGFNVQSGGNGSIGMLIAKVAPAAGSRTYKVQMKVDSGTGRMYASSDSPSFIMVEEIGGGSGSSYPTRAVMWHNHATITVGAGTLTPAANTNQYFNMYTQIIAAANGNAFTQSFLLKAGTYTLSVLGFPNTDSGKLDWYIDDVLVASAQDWYDAGGTTYNVIKTASVTVVGSGRHVLKGVVNGKHASSTDYRVRLTSYWLAPSADTFELSANGGGYNEGTVFPVSPTANDKFYRTDRNLLYYYDGTRWLTVQQFKAPLYHPGDINLNFNATITVGGLVPDATYGMYLERLEATIYVATTNNGSNYWTIGLISRVAADTPTTIVSVDTSSDSAATVLRKSATINAVLASTALVLQAVLTKTSSPGVVYYFSPTLIYRLIG
jgi:hypothetical protein